MRVMFKSIAYLQMAGLAGFEPAHDGIKTRCLTTWRQPKRIKTRESLKCQ